MKGIHLSQSFVLVVVICVTVSNYVNRVDCYTPGTPSTRRSFVKKVTILTTAGINILPAASSGLPNPLDLLQPNSAKVGSPIVYGDESIMSKKSHGTTESAVQKNLLFDIDREEADRICSYNRHFAESAGTFLSGPFVEEMRSLKEGEEKTFFDSVTGKPLFVGPRGRTVEEFLAESKKHGWPSFRDEEVVWENVRVLRNSGETVAESGTHLGHNLPDSRGNRYCINLCCIAGRPA